MKDNIESFPKPPRLPEMTVQERQLWAASHRLPENMTLVSLSEATQMNVAIKAMGHELRLVHAELQAWQKMMRLMVGTPEREEAIKRLIAMRDELNALKAAQEKP